jgi:hypothetical protein
MKGSSGRVQLARISRKVTMACRMLFCRRMPHRRLPPWTSIRTPCSGSSSASNTETSASVAGGGDGAWGAVITGDTARARSNVALGISRVSTPKNCPSFCARRRRIQMSSGSETRRGCSVGGACRSVGTGAVGTNGFENGMSENGAGEGGSGGGPMDRWRMLSRAVGRGESGGDRGNMFAWFASIVGVPGRILEWRREWRTSLDDNETMVIVEDRRPSVETVRSEPRFSLVGVRRPSSVKNVLIDARRGVGGMRSASVLRSIRLI